jgi:nucleoside-diphosphate-sugar epimerase
MTGRRALIVGGTGLLGRRIVAALARRGVEAPGHGPTWRQWLATPGDGP